MSFRFSHLLNGHADHGVGYTGLSGGHGLMSTLGTVFFFEGIIIIIFFFLWQHSELLCLKVDATSLIIELLRVHSQYFSFVKKK